MFFCIFLVVGILLRISATGISDHVSTTTSSMSYDLARARLCQFLTLVYLSFILINWVGNCVAIGQVYQSSIVQITHQSCVITRSWFDMGVQSLTTHLNLDNYCTIILFMINHMSVYYHICKSSNILLPQPQAEDLVSVPAQPVHSLRLLLLNYFRCQCHYSAYA